MEGRLAGLMDARQGPLVRLYTRSWCGYCWNARRLFKRLGIPFEEISVDGNPKLRAKISATAGNWPTVPMIFVGGQFVGGYSEAAALHRRGELLALCGRQET
jgi:glutaredoxin 3